MKKKLIILSIIAIVLIGIIAGGSYAYFTVGNSTGNEDVITSGTMSLLLTDGAEVTANNLVPGDYVEKTFKVKNTGNVDTRYDIYLSEVINTFVDKTDLVYTLTSLDGGYNTSSEVQVPDTETKIVNQQLITPNAEHTYTLRLTFKQKQTVQNANMGRTFTAKININEYNTNTSEHFLKLIDASGNEVDKQILASGQSEYTLALNSSYLIGSTNIYCNNGGIPTINGNTLNVTGITTDSVCTISNDIMDTMANKLTTAKTGVVMTNNQSEVTKMTVPVSKEVVLDLNGKQMKTTSYGSTSTTYDSNQCVFEVLGSMTVNDNGNGGLYSSPQGIAITSATNSSLIINNGIFSGRQAVISRGSTVINDGYFTSPTYQAIIVDGGSEAKTVINGGNYEITQNVDLIRKEGDSILDINNGDFKSAGKSILNNKGLINVYGGNFESSADNTIYNSANGRITINGNQATLDSNGNYLNGLYVHSNAKAQLINNYGTMNIKDGTFKTFYRDAVGECDVYNNGGTLVIDGGDYYSYRDINIYASGDSSDITINGGTYYSELHTNVFHNFGTMKIYGGTFNSKNKSFMNSNKGTLYIVDGTFNGKMTTAVNGSANASVNYICGGTFTNTGNDLIINDADSSLKYKSSVVWTGKTGPTVGGSYPSLATLDDTITCPSILYN